MKNTRLLTLILKETNDLITSNEYKEAYSLGNSFSRNRKLSFSNTVHFICSALRKSISSEINNFIEDHKYLKIPSITKQAFSKARQKISPEAFNELCRLFVDKFYSLNKNLNTWNGFNILAVDGTSLQVPDTKECGEYFGLSSNQNKTRTAIATASALYDVLNDIIVDARLAKLNGSKCNNDVFDETALEAIANASNGVPRIINKICDSSLMIGNRCLSRELSHQYFFVIKICLVVIF